MASCRRIMGQIAKLKALDRPPELLAEVRTA